MLDTIFGSIFSSSSDTVSSVEEFLLCIAVALVLGAVIALTYTYQNRYTKSFIVTLALLPSLVSVVIMMVNGNIGAGVAVAGAFSLIRFRSAPGTAKEIISIFLSMCVGLVIGMGYLGYAALIAIIICLVMFLLQIGFAHGLGGAAEHKTLRVTVPEDLDYTNMFDDLFEKYTSYHKLISAKSTNLGSLFKLTYDIRLKNGVNEKNFVDEMRCRNGNLEIMVGVKMESSEEL